MLDGLLLLPVGLDWGHASRALGWLWLALVASGFYHGANPGMGWPLAVSAGLMDKSPRALARIPPTQLALWSFAVAIAHGAALMLVPIYLGLCQAFELDAGHEAAGALMKASLGMAVLVSLVHVAAMVSAGGCLAWLVYRYLGLRFVARSWFNLDMIWAISLILVGVVALVFNLASWQ